MSAIQGALGVLLGPLNFTMSWGITSACSLTVILASLDERTNLGAAVDLGPLLVYLYLTSAPMAKLIPGLLSFFRYLGHIRAKLLAMFMFAFGFCLVLLGINLVNVWLRHAGTICLAAVFAIVIPTTHLENMDDDQVALLIGDTTADTSPGTSDKAEQHTSFGASARYWRKVSCYALAWLAFAFAVFVLLQAAIIAIANTIVVEPLIIDDARLFPHEFRAKANVTTTSTAVSTPDFITTLGSPCLVSPTPAPPSPVAKSASAVAAESTPMPTPEPTPTAVPQVEPEPQPQQPAATRHDALHSFQLLFEMHVPQSKSVIASVLASVRDLQVQLQCVTFAFSIVVALFLGPQLAAIILGCATVAYAYFQSTLVFPRLLSHGITRDRSLLICMAYGLAFLLAFLFLLFQLLRNLAYIPANDLPEDTTDEPELTDDESDADDESETDEASEADDDTIEADDFKIATEDSTAEVNQRSNTPIAWLTPLKFFWFLLCAILGDLAKRLVSLESWRTNVAKKIESLEAQLLHFSELRLNVEALELAMKDVKTELKKLLKAGKLDEAARGELQDKLDTHKGHLRQLRASNADANLIKKAQGEVEKLEAALKVLKKAREADDEAREEREAKYRQLEASKADAEAFKKLEKEVEDLKAQSGKRKNAEGDDKIPDDLQEKLDKVSRKLTDLLQRRIAEVEGKMRDDTAKRDEDKKASEARLSKVEHDNESTQERMNGLEGSQVTKEDLKEVEDRMSEAQSKDSKRHRADADRRHFIATAAIKEQGDNSDKRIDDLESKVDNLNDLYVTKEDLKKMQAEAASPAADTEQATSEQDDNSEQRLVDLENNVGNLKDHGATKKDIEKLQKDLASVRADFKQHSADSSRQSDEARQATSEQGDKYNNRLKVLEKDVRDLNGKADASNIDRSAEQAALASNINGRLDSTGVQVNGIQDGLDQHEASTDNRFEGVIQRLNVLENRRPDEQTLSPELLQQINAHIDGRVAQQMRDFFASQRFLVVVCAAVLLAMQRMKADLQARDNNNPSNVPQGSSGGGTGSDPSDDPQGSIIGGHSRGANGTSDEKPNRHPSNTQLGIGKSRGAVMREIDGWPIQPNGDVLDGDGNIVGRAKLKRGIEGDISQLGGFVKCDQQRYFRNEDGKAIGRLWLPDEVGFDNDPQNDNNNNNGHVQGGADDRAPQAGSPSGPGAQDHGAPGPSSSRDGPRPPMAPVPSSRGPVPAPIPSASGNPGPSSGSGPGSSSSSGGPLKSRGLGGSRYAPDPSPSGPGSSSSSGNGGSSGGLNNPRYANKPSPSGPGPLSCSGGPGAFSNLGSSQPNPVSTSGGKYGPMASYGGPGAPGTFHPARNNPGRSYGGGHGSHSSSGGQGRPGGHPGSQHNSGRSSGGSGGPNSRKVTLGRGSDGRQGVADDRAPGRPEADPTQSFDRDDLPHDEHLDGQGLEQEKGKTWKFEGWTASEIKQHFRQVNDKRRRKGKQRYPVPEANSTDPAVWARWPATADLD